MAAYYNEHDKYAAQWLRNLIAAGHIAPGEVDERSIVDIRPSELAGFTQCHFFAGIGVWSYALRRAGWPDDRPVWTGSCPCQPFSAAGKRGGSADERHLWPVWYELIRQCRPEVIFGEQVASAQVVGGKGEGSDLSVEVSEGASRQGFDSPRQVQGATEGYLFRPNNLRETTSVEDRRGAMRGDWLPVQFGWRENLGQSINRPGQSCGRLHLCEYPSCLPCGEQRPRGLGGATTSLDCVIHSPAEAREVERLVREISRASYGIDQEAWFDAISTDLEEAHYSCWPCDLPAAGVGAPHIRQRLFFVADAEHAERRPQHGPEQDVGDGQDVGRAEAHGQPGARSSVCELADSAVDRSSEERLQRVEQQRLHENVRRNSRATELEKRATGVAQGDTKGPRLAQRRGERGAQSCQAQDDQGKRPERASLLVHAGSEGCQEQRRGPEEQEPARTPQPATPNGPCNGFWADAEWIPCRDGKARPVEPGTFPLAHGAPARVGRLRAYGNAIVAPLAEEFIRAYVG